MATDIKQKLVLLLATVAIIYRQSFTSPFFQDDKLLLSLSQTGNIFQVIPNFPYRPVSLQLFYFLSQQFFSRNVFGYHFVLFLFFAATVFVIFKLSTKILADKNKALVATVFYALNISLFANFYWVATSYFSIGALFFFLTIWFYLQPGKKYFWLTTLSFLLAVGSNEISFVLPGLFLIANWYFNYWPKRFVFFAVAMPVILGLRSLIGLPKASDYTININTQVLSTLRWYFFRALDLPEGVNRSSDKILLGSFAVTAVIYVSESFSWLRSKVFNVRLLLFGGTTFLLSFFPFLFLPGHMSSYYLTMALFGPALIIGEIITNRKLLVIWLVSYLILTVSGLSFLSQTHWIILKNTGPIGSF